MKVFYDNSYNVLMVLDDGEPHTIVGCRAFAGNRVLICTNGLRVSTGVQVPADFESVKYFFNGKTWMIDPDYNNQNGA